MPASSREAVVERRLAENEESGDRYIDLRVDVVRKTTGEIILTTGGRYDHVAKRYADEPPQVRRILEVQEAQVEAARWFSDWFKARRLSQYLYTDEGKPIFSVALVGGRRAGKSDLVIRIALAYAVENPRSIVWIIAPTQPDTPEIDRKLEELLPATWYTYVGDPWFVYTLANGSEIHVKSSYKVENLKKGRVDIAIIHEAQLHDARAYARVRFAIADRGGLVILAANPPDSARGLWVEDFVEKANAGKFGGRVFVLNPRLNSEIEHAALQNLEDEFDERTLRRERDGEFGLPRSEAVFWAFSEALNVERAPDHAGLTLAFLRRLLNAEATWCHGMDFQQNPWQVANSLRFYEDPSDPAGDPLVWICDETLIEQATEEELIDAMEARGYSGADIIIPDASGEWQDSERRKGRASCDMLRKRGWRKIFLPDANSRKNPPILERMAVGNSLLRSASGRRKLRIDPRCYHTIRSVKHWENRNGVPNRRSEFAHAADAWTYPAYRLFPRRAPGVRMNITILERPAKRGWEELGER